MKKKKKRQEMSTSTPTDADMLSLATMRAQAVSPECLANGTAEAARIELGTREDALKHFTQGLPSIGSRDPAEGSPKPPSRIARAASAVGGAVQRGVKKVQGALNLATDCDMAALARERAKALSRGENLSEVVQDKANAAADAAPATKPGDTAKTGRERKLKKGKKASNEIALK